jgi:hypothetical protein
MRLAIPNLSELVSWLTGTGAVHNARSEVTDATVRVTELESQLRDVVDPNPRRAA